jgi:hypothetical protein
MMTLVFVLWAKIAITAAFWAGPLLLAPEGLFGRLGFPPRPMVFIRLLGAAYLALLVGYVLGLRTAQASGYPGQTVTVGIVSNGLACLLIVYYGVRGSYRPWGGKARAFMWASALAAGLITLGLFLTGRP